MKKRLIALVMAAMLLVGAATPALAAAPKIRKVECEGNGVVEVDFKTENVRYKNVKVTVKDAKGKTYSASIREKDDDDLTFKVKGLKANTKYAFTISGVRAGKSGSFGSVTGSFRTPSESAAAIKRIEYDAEDRELEIEFATKVQFKGLKVEVKDAQGNALAVKKVKKGSDEVEVKLQGVVRGNTYAVNVSGVSVKGKNSYGSVKGTFVAR